jgi:multidrug efflux pump subunit AcrB
MQSSEHKGSNGAISWMAGHGVAANLLMAICLLGGLLALRNIKQEVFPEFQIDTVSVQASPEEIESGIILAVEDAISDLDGIDDINSKAKEGVGLILADVVKGADVQRLAHDIQQEVDRITTFPEDAEEPKIKVVTRKRQVLSLAIYGQTKEAVLHELAEQFRDNLLQDPGITQVELEGVKPLEISIEIPQGSLRRYRLTLAEIAQRIQKASVDLPGGSIKTTSGEILIRMKERKDYGRQFARIPIITAANGGEVLLGEIAKISDGYEDTGYSAAYNQHPAVMVQVYSVGTQTPIQVSEAVKRHLDAFKAALPKGIAAEIRFDTSDQYAQRIDLLMRNSAQGLVLVFIALALFLDLRYAFWVMMGIPTAFLGSFLILPLLGVSINMVSLFAFIIALGIVVDDAIVIGENVYHYRQQGMPPMQAAIEGAREMAMPVTFSVLTNIVTFIPLYFMPGEMGKIFYMIPTVIISVFSISLLESIFILPNHLAHLNGKNTTGRRAWFFERQQQFSKSFEYWVQHRYGTFLTWILRHRYLTIVAAFALLFTTLAYTFSGRMGMSAFPKTESDFAKVTVTLPYGSPVEKTQAIAQKIIASTHESLRTVQRGDELVKGIFTEVGKAGESHTAEIRVYLASPEVREEILSTEEFIQLWRKTVGELIGVDSMRFESDAGGPGSGSAMTIEFNHPDLRILEQASKELAEALRGYPLVKDVDDGFSPGKQQLDFTILPEGNSLGLTAQTVARQVRNAFYGAEVLRQQRGRNEIKIMVRLPEDERIRQTHLEELLLWTATGKEIPLKEAVQIKPGRAYTEINRHNGRRSVQVTANITPKSKAGEILQDLAATVIPDLIKKYPGLQYSFEGQEADMAESVGSLKLSFVFSLLAIYCLLAIPFQNYILPLIVIVSIPFGIIGAIFGHLLLGYDLSIISLLGIVALSGVAVNDALVLIEHATYLKINGNQQPVIELIKTAAIQRFRPVILTTLTTFGGLMPMILETSRQARFLVPMAISIGFGILFATLITLILIPSLYVVVDDVRNWWGGQREI